MNTKKPVLIFTEQMARESFIFDGPVNLTPNKLKPISVGVKTDLKQNIRGNSFGRQFGNKNIYNTAKY